MTISGLADGEYYVKSTQSSAVSNASQVLLDKDSDGDYSVFKVTQSGGVLTELTKVGSGGRWEAKNNKIRAKLKKGSNKLILSYEPANENMNDKGVNRAMLDYVRLIKMN